MLTISRSSFEFYFKTNPFQRIYPVIYMRNTFFFNILHGILNFFTKVCYYNSLVFPDSFYKRCIYRLFTVTHNQ